jgi:tellurite resistance protein TehA-like permease
MNAGVLGLLLHQLPYQFHGLKIIATIFYVLDLLLFVFFSIIFLLRFVLYGATAYREITSEQPELMLCACWPIAFMTLTSLTSLITSNAYWGHSFTMVAYVMWWFVSLWTTIFLFWTFIILIREHEASDRRLPMTVILPAVSVSTAAVEGGIVASMSHNISPTLAVPVIIVGFMLVGIGILLGLMLTVYLFHALLAKGWPPAAQTASLFIFVGPMGQSAYG